MGKYLSEESASVVRTLQSLIKQGFVSQGYMPPAFSEKIHTTQDWLSLTEDKRGEYIAAIEAGAGRYNTDKLFYLLWAVASLDINIFAAPFQCGLRLLDNLEDNAPNVALQAKDEEALSAQHFPKVIWALTLFLRKYANDNVGLQEKLCFHLQKRIDALAKKADSLAPYERYSLMRTRQCLGEYQAQITWPEVLVTNMQKKSRHKNRDKVSDFEKAVYSAFVQAYPTVKFKQSHEVGANLHTVDIVVDSLKLAIEVDGPGHFYRLSLNEHGQRLTTKTWLRNQMLSDKGWTVISIPYYAWEAAGAAEEAKIAYLKTKLSPNVETTVNHDPTSLGDLDSIQSSSTQSPPAEEEKPSMPSPRHGEPLKSKQQKKSKKMSPWKLLKQHLTEQIDKHQDISLEDRYKVREQLMSILSDHDKLVDKQTSGELARLIMGYVERVVYKGFLGLFQDTVVLKIDETKLKTMLELLGDLPKEAHAIDDARP